MTAVLLVSIDSVIPNLALMKIAGYYKELGIPVGFNVENPTHAYISCIFKANRDIAKSSAVMLGIQYPGIVIDIGGPGYDLFKTLPEPIERHAPDYDLYPSIDYSIGFTTRGCIRNCPFCIVPVKEGKIKRVNTIEEIYNPRFNQIKLLDNNIMADHRNFRHVMEFCHDYRLKVDVSQGLDCRLMTPENAELLADVKPMANFVFAFDSLSYKRQVIECIEMLRDAGMDLHSNVMFYVYCDRTIDGEYGFKSALERCKILKENNTNPYVMLNIDAPPTQDMKNLKRWANRKHIFWSCQFEDYTRKVRA